VEMNVYRLLHELGGELGPWIGWNVKEIGFYNHDTPPRPLLAQGLHLPTSRPFAPRRREEDDLFQWKGNILEVIRRKFEEQNNSGQPIGRGVFREYIVPRDYGTNTVSVLPVWKSGNKIYVGLHRRELPAVQHFENTAAIWTVPTRRIGAGKQSADLICREAMLLLDEIGLGGGPIMDPSLRLPVVVKPIPLGGPYFSSPGVTPEMVHPYCIDVIGFGYGFGNRLEHDLLNGYFEPLPLQRDVFWIPLLKIVEDLTSLQDANLAISALRLSHALVGNWGG